MNRLCVVRCDKGRLWGGFLFLALVARLAVFAANVSAEEPKFTTPDSGGYLRAAESLRSHLGLMDESGRPAWSRVPGYPLLLAFLFEMRLSAPERLEGAVLVQILLAALVVPMSMFAAFRLAGVPAAFSAGLLMALEPSSLAFSNLIMTETFFTFMLLAAVVAWQRWCDVPSTGSLGLFAALIGVLPLIRPVATYLPFFVMGALLLTGPAQFRRPRAAILYLTLALLPNAAWSLRNQYYFGTTELDKAGPQAKAMFARAVEDLAGEPRPSSNLRQPWEQDFGQDQGLSVPDAIKIQNDYLKRTLAVHPFTAMRRVVLTGTLMVGVPDAELPALVLRRVPSFEEGSVLGRLRWLENLGPLSILLLLGMAISLGGLMMIPITGLRARKWDSGRKSVLALIIVLILYHLGFSSTISYQAARYRTPVMPLLAIVLAVGLAASARGADGHSGNQAGGASGQGMNGGEAE